MLEKWLRPGSSTTPLPLPLPDRVDLDTIRTLKALTSPEEPHFFDLLKADYQQAERQALKRMARVHHPSTNLAELKSATHFLKGASQNMGLMRVALWKKPSRKDNSKELKSASTPCQLNLNRPCLPWRIWKKIYPRIVKKSIAKVRAISTTVTIQASALSIRPFR